MSTRISNLDHLPVELLYDIHAFALSPALPLASHHLYAVFKSAPNTIHADYLIGCYQEGIERSLSVRDHGLVSHVLRYPICTRPVLEAIFRNPKCPGALQHTRTVLPRRLFRWLGPRDEPGKRPWTAEDEPLPFLQFLYNHERVPDVETNSYDGYALTRAVYANFNPLICFLLSKGASPHFKSHLAVTVAIRRKSLPLVRMLIERDGPHAVQKDDIGASRKGRRSKLDGDQKYGGKRQRGSSDADTGPSRGVKKRKLGDRVPVTQQMLKTAVKCDARDIVDYFMKDKECVPDLQTVLMMSGSR